MKWHRPAQNHIIKTIYVTNYTCENLNRAHARTKYNLIRYIDVYILASKIILLNNRYLLENRHYLKTKKTRLNMSRLPNRELK